MNGKQREALRNVLDRINTLDKESEEIGHTCTGEAWQIMDACRTTIGELLAPSPGEPPYYACPECGCTDVEMTAWVKINTDELLDDEGPLSEIYCPQCEETSGRSCYTVDKLKPYEEGKT